MDTCKGCSSNRIAFISGKCSDCCTAEYKGFSTCGYVPMDMGVGGNNEVEFKYCLDCGKIQGDFPIYPTQVIEEGDGPSLSYVKEIKNIISSKYKDAPWFVGIGITQRDGRYCVKVNVREGLAIYIEDEYEGIKIVKEFVGDIVATALIDLNKKLGN